MSGMPMGCLKPEVAVEELFTVEAIIGWGGCTNSSAEVDDETPLPTEFRLGLWV